MTYAQTTYALTPAELSEIDAERASERATDAQREHAALLDGALDCDENADVRSRFLEDLAEHREAASALMRLLHGRRLIAGDAERLARVRQATQRWATRNYD